MENRKMLPMVIPNKAEVVNIGATQILRLSRRNYVLEIYGDDLAIANNNGFLPVLPRHERLARSISVGDLIFVYVRAKNPIDSNLEKLFYGIGVVTRPDLELIDVPSYKDLGYAVQVKYLENKKLSLYSAKYIAKFVSRKEAGTQFRYGFFEILGSDAEVMLERMGLCQSLREYVSA